MRKFLAPILILLLGALLWIVFQPQWTPVTPLEVPDLKASQTTAVAKADFIPSRVTTDLSPGKLFDNRGEKIGQGNFGMHGMVVDAQGTPVGNAWVAAYSSPFPLLDVEQGFEEILSKPLEFSLEPLASAKTNERGEFQLEGVPGRSLYLTARAPQLLTRGRRHVPASVLLSTDGVTLTTHPAASIQGRVVDARGAPVPGAEVLVNPGIKYLIAAFRNREFFVERVFADAAGAFHLEAVPAGMVLSLSGFASSTQPGVKELGPLPGKQEAKIEVRLDDGGSLQGKVVAESGKGISQATVAVVPLDLRRIIPLFRDFPAWTAQTNSKGDYIFPFLPKGNYLTIAQSIDGRSQPGQAILAGSASRAPDLLIPETQLIQGRVIDVEGKPVPFAKVALMSLPNPVTNDTEKSSRGRQSMNPLLEAAREIIPEFLPADTMARTDEQGRFSLPGWNHARVRVTSLGFLDGDYKLGNLEENPLPVLLLNRPGTASGIVVRADREDPVPFFTIQAEMGYRGRASSSVDSVAATETEAPTSLSSQETQGEFLGEQENLLTPSSTPMRKLGNAKWFDNSDGSFSMQGLSSGPWTFVFRAEGLTNHTLEVTIPESGEATGLLVSMVRGAGLGGRVIDKQTGQPIASATVSGGVGQGSGLGTLLQGFWEGNPVTETAEDGTFLLEGLEEGADHIHVLADGYAALSKKGSPLEAGELREDLELELGRGGSIQGTVVDRHGNLLARRMVACLTMAGQDFGQTGTDERGAFSFENMRPGTYFMIAAALDDDSLFSGDFASILTGGRLVTATVEENEVTEIELLDPSSGGCEVSGQITKNGNPVPYAQLTAADNNAGMFNFSMASVKSDAEGNFVFKSLAPSEYTLRVESNDWGGNLKMSVPDTPTHWLDVRVPESVVKGFVRSMATDAPVSGVPVHLVDMKASPGGGFALFGGSRSSQGPNSRQTETDAKGNFQFEGTPHGEYRVEVRQKNRGGMPESMFYLESHGETFSLSEDGIKDVGVIYLESAGAISVEVVDSNGDPIKQGFSVKGVPAYADMSGNDYSTWGWNGNGSLGGLPAGEWTVKVESRGMAPMTSDPVFVEMGEVTNIRLVMSTGVTLKVRVLGNNGENIADAALVLLDYDGNLVSESDSAAARFRNMFGGDGVQRVGSFAPGRYLLEVTADGITKEFPMNLTLGDEAVVTVRL
ncbi:MAG: carboxypeptidase-like regulatory domain-containing protein [Planctomycetota bacterium]|nr:carboxypeptidase-like regulatory domain-containing protein [Planctomycetota bacterium]